ncbi:MAG: CU044_5270 family protein [Nocardioides sp.]
MAHGIPTRDVSPRPGDGARAAAELARILALPQRRPPLRRRLVNRWSRRRPTRFVLPVVATVAALAVGFFVVVRPGGSEYIAEAGTPPLLRLGGVDAGALPASGESAAETLRQLAIEALGLPYDARQPVQQVVVDSWLSESAAEIGAGDAQSVLRSVQRETYVLPDDIIRSIERRGGPLDQAGRVTSPVEEDGPRLSDESFPIPDRGHDYAERLPTDPAQLRAALLDGYDAATLAQAPGGALLLQISSLIGSYVLPPRLISAIWQMLADEPSVTLLGTAQDRRGREALVLSTPSIDGYGQQLLLADPESGAILGDEVVLVKSSPTYSFTPPAVISFNTIVRSARVPLAEVPAEP